LLCSEEAFPEESCYGKLFHPNGEFGVNQIGPFVKLVGSSVIVAHRLLKNSVPGHEYILMTQQALQYLPDSVQREFVTITESLPNFGDLLIGYRLLERATER